MLERWKNNWLKNTGYEKCYFIAFWIAFLALCFFIRGKEYKDLSYALIDISAGFCIFGVLIWSAPIVKTEYLIKKLKDSLINCAKGIIAIAAIGCSRMYVSDALGLPPNDFELTVGILAILIGYILWILIFVFLANLVGISFLIYAVLTDTVGKTHLVFSDLNKKSTNYYLGHAIGVLVLAYAGYSFLESGEQIIKNNYSLIRFLAYALDYQKPKQYPLVKPKMLFRLHDNGIVSYAELNGWDVKITVGEISK